MIITCFLLCKLPSVFHTEKNISFHKNGLGSLSHEERLRELVLFSLKKGKLRGYIIIMFQYFKGGYKEDEDSLSQGVTRNRQEVMGTSWAHSAHSVIRHKRRMVCNENNEPLKYSLKERCWIPQHWMFLRLSRTGSCAILSIWCLCQERLDQIILEIPSIINSMIL